MFATKSPYIYLLVATMWFQWKGLNLYSRGKVLKIASFEGPMILRVLQNKFFPKNPDPSNL